MKLLAFLFLLPIVLTCGPATAAIRFAIDDVSILTRGVSTITGEISVVVRADPSDLPQDVSSFSVAISSHSSVLTFTEPRLPDSGELLSGPVESFSNSPQQVLAAVNIVPSSSPLFNGGGLIQAPFEVDQGELGSFEVSFVPFLNDLSNQLSQTLTIDVSDTATVSVSLASRGDYNADGVVDAADLSIWRSSVGSSTMLDADGSADLVINGADYAAWRNDLSTASTATAQAAVPEPAVGHWIMASLVVRLGFWPIRRPVTARASR